MRRRKMSRRRSRRDFRRKSGFHHKNSLKPMRGGIRA